MGRKAPIVSLKELKARQRKEFAELKKKHREEVRLNKALKARWKRMEATMRVAKRSKKKKRKRDPCP